MAADVLQARLREMGERFLASLAEELAALRALTSAAPDAPDAPDAANAIVHRVAGRAGTFGFPAISIQASRLESLIIDGQFGAPAFELALAELEALASAAREAVQ